MIFCTRDATDEEATIEQTLRPQGQEHSAAYLTKGGAALVRSYKTPVTVDSVNDPTEREPTDESSPPHPSNRSVRF